MTYPQLCGFQKRFDARILSCLEKAGVAKLAESGAGLDRVHDEWDDVLSGGERQRIGFARLFWHAPKFAILDEATSACNAEGETALYTTCVNEGITLLSIAHRMELRRFHQAELALVGDGSGAWTLTTLTH